MSPMDHTTPEVTHDSLFNGELTCLQHKDGYRFSIDSVLLAHFIHPGKGDTILDLGTGCGIISLILAYRWEGVLKSITGVENQAPLANLAKRNIDMNGYEELCRVVKGDVKTLFQSVEREFFSRVVCNPPFYEQGTGRINKNKEAHLARHQISATLADFISTAASAIKNKGTAYFIYPADRLSYLISTAMEYRLEPKKIRFVYSYPHPEKKAELVLIKFLKNGGTGVEVMAPFYVYTEKNGAYSPEMASYYR